MDPNFVLTCVGALISIGIIYGRFATESKEHKQRISALEKQVSGMVEHNNMLIEVKTKVDLLITHLLNHNKV